MITRLQLLSTSKLNVESAYMHALLSASYRYYNTYCNVQYCRTLHTGLLQAVHICIWLLGLLVTNEIILLLQLSLYHYLKGKYNKHSIEPVINYSFSISTFARNSKEYQKTFVMLRRSFCNLVCLAASDLFKGAAKLPDVTSCAGWRWYYSLLGLQRGRAATRRCNNGRVERPDLSATMYCRLVG